MKIWEININILKKQFPALFDEIANAENPPSGPDIKIETASSGNPGLLINGLHITSRDPCREGQRAAEAAIRENPAPDLLVVLGFGLGYTAEALARLLPDLPLIIIEKNTFLLRKALECRNLEALLSRKNTFFLPGSHGENIIDVLSLLAGKNEDAKKLKPLVIRSKYLTGFDEQWYNSIENRIKSFVMRDDVNEATLKKFGKRWIKNISRNMSKTRDLPGILAFKGFAVEKHFPVFLAAAGPSLDKVASLLPEIYKRCIVISADTSLSFLQRNGVFPDFALTVDPQFWNSRHLDRCANPRTILIAETAVYPPVFRMSFSGIFLCGSLFPLGKFIEERVDNKGQLGTGGSVATAAWDFARMLGTNEIWTAGLDLSFPGLKTHFKGSLSERKMLEESNRFRPAETSSYNALHSAYPFKAKAISGGEVLSDRRLSLYAAWFENNFRKYPGIRSLSLGNEGLLISGLEAASPQALLELPLRRSEIDKCLAETLSRTNGEFFDEEQAQERFSRYANALSNLSEEIDSIKAACKKGIKIIGAARENKTDKTEQEKILAEIDSINLLIANSSVKEIAGFLFSHEANDNASGDFNSFLESLDKFYGSLLEAAEFGFLIK